MKFNIAGAPRQAVHGAVYKSVGLPNRELYKTTLKQLQFIEEARRMREDQSLSKAAFEMFLAAAPPGTIISE